MGHRAVCCGVFLMLAFAVLQPTRAGDTSPEIDRYELKLDLVPDKERMAVRGVLHAPISAVVDNIFSVQLTALIETVDFSIAGETIERVDRKDVGSEIVWKLFLKQNPGRGDDLAVGFDYVFEHDFAPQLRVESGGAFAGGSGEIWYPQRDFAIRNTGRISISVPRTDTAIATGSLQRSHIRGGRREFVFYVDTPSKFAFAAGPYSVERKAGGDAPFAVYALSGEHRTGAMFDIGGAIQNDLTRRFGSPLYPEMALVEVNFKSRVLGASEAGFILADASQFGSFDFLYWAHEFAHQWWGQTVASEGGAPGATMFSEGMAQFSAMMVLSDLVSPAAATALRRTGLAKRRDGAEAYFEMVDDGRDRPIESIGSSQDEIITLHRLANSKGAFVLFMLSEWVGHERMMDALRGIAQEFRQRRLAWGDLENALSRYLGEDFDWFFDQWLGRTGASSFRLCWRAENMLVKGVIRQSAPVYRARIELLFTGEGPRPQTRTETVEVKDTQTPFEFDLPFRAVAAELDPDFKVLRRPLTECR